MTTKQTRHRTQNHLVISKDKPNLSGTPKYKIGVPPDSWRVSRYKKNKKGVLIVGTFTYDHNSIIQTCAGTNFNYHILIGHGSTVYYLNNPLEPLTIRNRFLDEDKQEKDYIIIGIVGGFRYYIYPYKRFSKVYNMMFSENDPFNNFTPGIHREKYVNNYKLKLEEYGIVNYPYDHIIRTILVIKYLIYFGFLKTNSRQKKENSEKKYEFYSLDRILQDEYGNEGSYIITKNPYHYPLFTIETNPFKDKIQNSFKNRLAVLNKRTRMFLNQHYKILYEKKKIDKIKRKYAKRRKDKKIRHKKLYKEYKKKELQRIKKQYKESLKNLNINAKKHQNKLNEKYKEYSQKIKKKMKTELYGIRFLRTRLITKKKRIVTRNMVLMKDMKESRKIELINKFKKGKERKQRRAVDIRHELKHHPLKEVFEQ